MEKKNNIKIYHWSDEAIAALMMTLQKAMLEQEDIREILKGWKLALDGDKMFVLNPPVFNLAALSDHDEDGESEIDFGDIEGDGEE